MVLKAESEIKIELTYEELRLAIVQFINSKLNESQRNQYRITMDNLRFIGNNDDLKAEANIQMKSDVEL